jgi:hypothetical protein
MKLIQGMNCYKAKERDVKECAVGGKACLGALMPKARRNHSYECRAFFWLQLHNLHRSGPYHQLS